MIEEKQEKQHLFNGDKKLIDIIDKNHPLVKLADSINWNSINEEFKGIYTSTIGHPNKPIRLMVGLHYLRYMFNLSDESIVYQFIENPYYQYFCGEDIFQHKFPIDRSSMSKFRERLKKRKLYKLLQETIKTGFENRVIKKSSIKKAVIDTTVSENNITFPSDAKLYYKGIILLVKESIKYSIPLRQKYTFKSKRALIMISRYNHAKQFKRRNKSIKELKNYLGRIYRDFIRKSENITLSHNTNNLLNKCNTLLQQNRYSKNKLYSFHKPDTLCISKGKIHKRYEFGFKTSLITTTKECFIIATNAINGNLYDGHTLNETLLQAKNNIKNITNNSINYLYADKGYKGHNNNSNTKIILETSYNKKQYKDLKRRLSIEAVISSLKRHHRLGVNYLKEHETNTIMSACGYNLKKIYNKLRKDALDYIIYIFNTHNIFNIKYIPLITFKNDTCFNEYGINHG